MRTVASLLLACCLAASFSSASGQDPEPDESNSSAYTEGLFLHGHVGGHGLSVEEGETAGGRGLGAKIGYGFSPVATLYLGVEVAGMSIADPGTQTVSADNYALALVDLGFQLNFRSKSSRTVPYVDGALTGIGAAYETGARKTAVFGGSGVSLGGGLKYFVTPALALDGGVRLLFGRYRQLERERRSRDVDLGVVAAQASAGLTLYLFR